MTLPITEKDISAKQSIDLRSPILCQSIRQIGLDTKKFIDFISPYFEGLTWDLYDVKRKQYE